MTVVSYGRTYDQLEPGQHFKHWPGRTVSAHDSISFALLSMNHNPLFIDRHVSPKTPVVDTLIFSLAVGMSVADTSGKTIANLGFEGVAFETPLYAGDSLYAESEVLDKRESESNPDRVIVHIETRAFNQRGERVLVLRRSFLAPKRDAS